MSEVRVVCTGYLRREGGAVREAHSTVSAIIDEGCTILVDTSSPAYRRRVVEGLEALGIDPGEVDVVVSTHLHHDHVANNDLFPRAELIAHRDEAPGEGYRAIAGEADIRPGVRIVHTPGHTRGSMSVVVDAADARYVLAGDALPTKDNYDRWLPPGISYDREVALRSMERIAALADVIVPGHDGPFRAVPREG